MQKLLKFGRRGFGEINSLVQNEVFNLFFVWTVKRELVEHNRVCHNADRPEVHWLVRN